VPGKSLQINTKIPITREGFYCRYRFRFHPGPGKNSHFENLNHEGHEEHEENEEKKNKKKIKEKHEIDPKMNQKLHLEANIFVFPSCPSCPSW